jgi:hypothetical protein
VRPRLSYANVVATLALFVALGGASYAAIELPANSVGSRQLRHGSVSTQKLGFALAMASAKVASVRVGHEVIRCSGRCPLLLPQPQPVVSVSLDLPRPSRVLVLATANLSAAVPEPENYLEFRIEPGNGPYGTRIWLDSADHDESPMTMQQSVWSGAGRKTFTLTSNGNPSSEATNVELVAIALPRG